MEGSLPETNPLKMNMFNGAVMKTPVAWGFFPTQENIGRKTSQYKDPYKDHCLSFFGPGSPCCCMPLFGCILLKRAHIKRQERRWWKKLMLL